MRNNTLFPLNPNQPVFYCTVNLIFKFVIFTQNHPVMRRVFLMLPIILLASLVAGQNAKENYLDGEFFFAQEDYEEALYAFTQVYKEGYQNNANINYRMGVCLLRIPGRKTEAIPYLEMASGSITDRYKEGNFKETSVPSDVLLYLGNAYRINMELDKAKEKYREYLTYLDPDDELMKAYTNKQIESCDNAVAAMNNPVKYRIGNLGQVNETQAQRYNMVISDDMSTMAFMGKTPFYNGVQVSTRQADGTWSKPLDLSPYIVSDGNMEVVALSPDGTIMLLAVSDEFDSNIYFSLFEKNEWTPAVSIGKPINSRYWESYATFAPDGKSIYFTSNREGSLGGMDIFRSHKLPNGGWSEPENLGPAINTELNEESPFFSRDGKRLYFSSQGHNTIGGYDLFYSEQLGDDLWGEPVNVGYPLNSTDDDLAFSPEGIHVDGSSLIYAKGSGDGFDLYKFDFIDENATPVPVPMEEPGEELAEEQKTEEQEAEMEQEQKVAETGPEVEVPEPPEKYLVKPVFFAFDRYDLSGTARSKLDDLATLMKNYPSLKLEIMGHTDAIGTFEYNQGLSVKRAKSVSEYLINNGISKDRLTIKGFSESEPVAKNRTDDNRDAPEGRKLNRRVQFRVSVTREVIIEMEQIQVPDYLKLN